MQQLEIVRPFGTEGVDVRIRFSGGWWTVMLVEWTGQRWDLFDSIEVRSSSSALSEAQAMLGTYADVLREEF